MAYLELADGKNHTTRVSAFYRNGHTTRSHIRHLSGGHGLVNDDSEDQIFYIKVPDPNNKLKPVFVREDFFDLYSDDDFSKLIRFVTPFNNKDYLSRLTVRRMNRTNQHHLNDAGLLSDLFGDIVNVVKIGAGFVPGVGTAVATGIGALQSITSSGQPTTKPVVAPDNVSNLHIVQAWERPYVPPAKTVYAYQGGLPGRPGVTSHSQPTGVLPGDVTAPSGSGTMDKILDSKVMGIPSVVVYPLLAFAAYRLTKK